MQNIKYPKVYNLIFKIFREIGSDMHTSKSIAEGLSYASLRGIDSHGIRLLPKYVNFALNQRKNINPKMKVYKKFPSLISIDADHAFGHAAGYFAMKKGSQIAKKNGICAISVFNSTHPGAMSSIVTNVTQNNLIGIGFTNADPLILSFNGKNSFFGTNPLCFAFPRKNKSEPFCLDMATSKITWNKLNMLKSKNKKLPKNSAADINGISTNNPFKAKSLFPIGDHKGYGLASIVEIFCSILSGMPFGPQIPPMFTSDPKIKRKISQFYIVMRNDFVISHDMFIKSLEKMISQVNSSEPSKLNKKGKVLLPNQPEIEYMKLRKKNGIPIDSALIKEINDLIIKNNLRIKKL